MTMTTVAGVTPSDVQHPGETPRNRAVEALEAAGGWVPIEHQATVDELTRDMAAYQLATDITEQAGYLTLRERIILAAALLPEFAVTDLQVEP